MAPLPDPRPRRARAGRMMVLVNNAISGAEKRYARLFIALSRQGEPMWLVINRRLYDLQIRSGVDLSSCDDRVLVIEPKLERWMERVTGSWGTRRRASILRLARRVDAVLSIFECWFLIRRLRPALVHSLVTGIYLTWLPLTVERRTGSVISAYSWRFESPADPCVLGVPVGTRLKLLALKRAHAVDALSHPIKDDLVSRGVEPGHIHVAPGSFIGIERCQPAPIKEDWVVLAGRLIDIKRPLLLVEAIPLVLERCPEARFFILGDGPLEGRIHERLHELGVGQAVTVGFTFDVVSIMAQSKVFVTLQTGENYPSQSLLEAMACGNAVVATDVGETWRLVDERTGIRIEPTPERLAQAIVTLLRHPDLGELGHSARRRILREHRIQSYVAFLLGLYRRVEEDLG
jgi:glycosyltransferase involved in cell wall biosynthesis